MFYNIELLISILKQVDNFNIQNRILTKIGIKNAHNGVRHPENYIG